MRLELTPSVIEYDSSRSDRIKVIFVEPQRIRGGPPPIVFSVSLNPALADLLIKELTRFCSGAGHPAYQKI